MSRYSSTPVIRDTTEQRRKATTIIPVIPISVSDIYIQITSSDRLDKLANTFYGDSTLWWIIAMANNNTTKGALYPKPGTQLRIPTDINNVLNQYKQFNKAR